MNLPSVLLLLLLSIQICEFGSSESDFCHGDNEVSESLLHLFDFSICIEPNQTVQTGSHVTVTCSQNAWADASVNASDILFEHRRHDSGISLLKPNFTFALKSILHIHNVSSRIHNGAYKCVNAKNNHGVSIHRFLWVKDAPPQPQLSAFWHDRRLFQADFHPVPANHSLAVEFADIHTGFKKVKCSSSSSICNCTSEGHCDWGIVLETVEPRLDEISITASLCDTQLNWCSSNQWKFDRRDVEQPSPAHSLNATFTRNGTVNFVYSPPTVPMGDQLYKYRVQGYRGECNSTEEFVKITNDTLVHRTQLKPYTLYCFCVQVKPRLYTGYWSVSVCEQFRSPAAVPCNPDSTSAFFSAHFLAFAQPQTPFCLSRGPTLKYIVTDLTGRNNLSVINSVNNIHPSVMQLTELPVNFTEVSVKAVTDAGVNVTAVTVTRDAVTKWIPKCKNASNAAGARLRLLTDTDRQTGKFALLLHQNIITSPIVSVCELSVTRRNFNSQLHQCNRVLLSAEVKNVSSSSRMAAFVFDVNLTSTENLLKLLIADKSDGINDACWCHPTPSQSPTPPKAELSESGTSVSVQESLDCSSWPAVDVRVVSSPEGRLPRLDLPCSRVSPFSLRCPPAGDISGLRHRRLRLLGRSVWHGWQLETEVATFARENGREKEFFLISAGLILVLILVLLLVSAAVVKGFNCRDCCDTCSDDVDSAEVCRTFYAEDPKLQCGGDALTENHQQSTKSTLLTNSIAGNNNFCKTHDANSYPGKYKYWTDESESLTESQPE